MASMNGNHPRQSVSSVMEQLPSDIISKALDRLNLAMCSALLLRYIAKERPGMWSIISPSGGVGNILVSSFSITDSMLSSLLVRVNAKSVTSVLNLNGCQSITGTGLEPLRDSRVLEVVKLPHKVINKRIVMDIFKTSFPFKLAQVLFCRYCLSADRLRYISSNRPPEETHDEYNARIAKQDTFECELRLAKYQRDIQLGVKCTGCNLSLAEESSQVVPCKRGLPVSQCAKCAGRYCRRGSCPVIVQDCHHCKETLCGHCEKLSRCDECEGSFCCCR